MREAGAGTLLFTTGGGSVDPIPMLGNVNAAAAALHNWVINLNKELAGSGVYAGHVAIGVWIGDGGPEGIPSATPEQIPPALGACTRPATAPRPSSPADRSPAPRHRTGRPTAAPAGTSRSCGPSVPGTTSGPRVIGC
jgi:hypothetical protein